jgi:hypothetical protein
MVFLILLIGIILIITIDNTANSVPEYAPSVEWNMRYGVSADTASSIFVLSTSDGGYLAGCTTYHVGGDVGSLVKIDEAGNLQWNRTWEAQFDYGIINALETPDGGYIVSGFIGIGGEWRPWLLKTGKDGVTEWNRTYDTGALSNAWLNYAEPTTDGGYILTGVCEYYNGTYTLLLIKTDSNGVPQLSRTYGGQKIGLQVHQISDGGYVIAGINVTDTGAELFHLIKTDTEGNIVFDRAYGQMVYESKVALTLDGGYLVAGTIWNGSNVQLLKVDFNGTLQWQQTCNTVQVFEFAGAEQTTDGGYVFAAQAGVEALGLGSEVVKVDAEGKIQWIVQKWPQYVLYPKARSIIQAADGGFVVAGESYGSLWVAKLTSSATYQEPEATTYRLLLAAASLEFVALLMLSIILVDSVIRERRGHVTHRRSQSGC